MITLFSAVVVPNGWKPAIILQELGLKYETKYLNLDQGHHKEPEFTKYNPNGRIPAIVDHDNDDIVIWESASIIRYLVDRYDQDKKISFPFGTPEYYAIQQWMDFQNSGQGPMFQQAAISKLAKEENPQVIERFEKEVDRILSVLDGVFVKEKYLVGNRVTVADLVFVPWDMILFDLLKDSEIIDASKYEHFNRWHKEIASRPSVVRCYSERSKLLASEE